MLASWGPSTKIAGSGFGSLVRGTDPRIRILPKMSRIHITNKRSTQGLPKWMHPLRWRRDQSKTRFQRTSKYRILAGTLYVHQLKIEAKEGGGRVGMVTFLLKGTIVLVQSIRTFASLQKPWTWGGSALNIFFLSDVFYCGASKA